MRRQRARVGGGRRIAVTAHALLAVVFAALAVFAPNPGAAQEVHVELEPDLLKELGAGLDRTVGGVDELLEQAPHLFVVGREKFNRVHGSASVQGMATLPLPL